MEVGDDVALCVPDEAGAGAARHLLHVHREQVALRPSEVMCTTEGETLRKSSMWASSSAASGPRGVTARGAASPRPCTAAGGTPPPAAYDTM
jgi:hypothetical protein